MTLCMLTQLLFVGCRIFCGFYLQTWANWVSTSISKFSCNCEGKYLGKNIKASVSLSKLKQQKTNCQLLVARTSCSCLCQVLHLISSVVINLSWHTLSTISNVYIHKAGRPLHQVVSLKILYSPKHKKVINFTQRKWKLTLSSGYFGNREWGNSGKEKGFAQFLVALNSITLKKLLSRKTQSTVFT